MNSTDFHVLNISDFDSRDADNDYLMSNASQKPLPTATETSLASGVASSPHGLPQRQGPPPAAPAGPLHSHFIGDVAATKRPGAGGDIPPPPKRVASPHARSVSQSSIHKGPLRTKNLPIKGRQSPRPSRSSRPTATANIIRLGSGRMSSPTRDSPTLEPKSPQAKSQPPSIPSEPHVQTLEKQPVSQSITQQQLAAEVKAIYHTLVQNEARCVKMVSARFTALQDKDPDNITALAGDEWKSLIIEHRKLLHDHHDFFLASQHPSSSLQLREIATKYSMPARMWKHGIHNFLELLRRHLPHSIEWMLAFIYLAYQMMALLYETIPGYEETWIECLGDLARYRMAVEDEDPRDRDNFTTVAGFWYGKAIDKNFHVGRLYHHKAILARSDPVKQLSLYARSLTARHPFASTMTSILTLLEPSLARQDPDRSLTNDVYFVQAHACIFLDRPEADFAYPSSCFRDTLSATITRLSSRWRDQGCFLLIANITALCGWGKKNALRDDFEARLGSNGSPSRATPGKAAPINPAINFTAFSATSQRMAYSMMRMTLSIVTTQHHTDKNVLAFGHILLTFTYSVASLETGQEHLRKWLDWTGVCMILNSAYSARSKLEKRPPEQFDPHNNGNQQPINEDYFIRGQIWAPPYLTKSFFEKSPKDQDERKEESPEVAETRLNRIAWLGVEIARMESKEGPWLYFDQRSGYFSTR